MQYKNTSKIKVLQMPWNLNMIFSRIFENIWHWEHNRGASTWPRGWRARPTPWAPPCLVGPRWPSSTYSCTHLLPLSHTNTKNQLKHEFQPRLLWFSISLLKAPLAKLLGEIVPWYVTPPLVQLVFGSSALFIANLCCIGDHVLELACQIYMVPSSSNALYRL